MFTNKICINGTFLQRLSWAIFTLTELWRMANCYTLMQCVSRCYTYMYHYVCVFFSSLCYFINLHALLSFVYNHAMIMMTAYIQIMMPVPLGLGYMPDMNTRSPGFMSLSWFIVIGSVSYRQWRPYIQIMMPVHTNNDDRTYRQCWPYILD